MQKLSQYVLVDNYSLDEIEGKICVQDQEIEFYAWTDSGYWSAVLEDCFRGPFRETVLEELEEYLNDVYETFR